MSEFNLEKVIRLLENARDKGVHLSLAEEELSVKFQKGSNIDKAILEELKLNKTYLIHYFKTYAVGGNKPRLLPIQKTDRDELNGIPVSFAQERLWFIDQLEGSVQYHIPTVLQLKGNLNIDALTYAIKQVVNRHEVLRTVIREKDGRAWQYIMPTDCWQLNVVDGTAYREDDVQLQNYIQQLVNQPFDLSKDCMLRAHLIAVNVELHLLVVTQHHIASDGWSNAIIVRELVALYNAFEKGTLNGLGSLPIQYADFSAWQRQYLQGPVLEKTLAYWKEKLNELSTLQLPVDFERPAVQSTRGVAISFNINKNISDQLKLLSNRQGATLFMTLLAAFNILLQRHTGQQDICVGTPIAGRDLPEVEQLIGFFINSLALRNDLSNDPSFTDLLNQVKTTTLEAYDHKELPFEKVVDAIVKERNLSRSPVFQVIFSLQNMPAVPEFRLGDVEMSVFNFDNNTSKYDLAFILTETDAGLHGSVRYCTELFKETTILLMIAHFSNLLQSIVNAPHQNIGTLSMLTKREEHQLLVDFNKTAIAYPAEKSIVDLFEMQVVAHPQATAIIFGNKKLSYLELNEKANQLARYLMVKGVTAESLVAISIERSLEMLVGILGVLKAGGAYLPIDADYPLERITFMLEDTAVKIVLTNTAVKNKLPVSDQFEMITLDEDWNEIATHPAVNLNVGINPRNLAYIIYTSGSTGKPKGVMIEHRGVINLALSQVEALRLKPAMVTLQFSSFSFDASCYEIFNTLLSGGSLVLPSKEVFLSAEKFEDFIKLHNVEVVVLPPSFQNVIKDALGTIKTVVSAGEPLNEVMGRHLIAMGIRLINAYGPTENTVCTTLTDHPFNDNKIIVIGKPVSNVQVYILDQANNLCPVGTSGEIVIGGIQLARGYFNQPQLTSEKFINNPFNNELGEKLYKSGDLGRWLPDGTIEYQGRIDEQVKLRGYRIEPGEIESCLLQSGLVNQAVVQAREDATGNRRLVGYVEMDGTFDRDAIMSYLQGSLPGYMVPTIWVVLKNFPLTSNGKIDKKALPAPEMEELLTNEYTAPRNEIEKQLTAIWQELLQVERIGINDNFFELGGDSILTIQAVSRIRRAGFELQPKDLFIHQTVAGLAAAIAERTGLMVVGEQSVLTGLCSLLPIQQWYLEMGQPHIAHFNQGVLLGLEKTITAAELEKAVDQLMDHHDALRFKYCRRNSKWEQEYGTYKARVIIEDLQSTAPDIIGSVITSKASIHQRKLDLEKGELVRVVYMQTPVSESNNRLLIVIHHLVIDGVSWRILLADLEFLLSELKAGGKRGLGTKSSSYRQWYHALENWGQRINVSAQLNYWQQAAKSYTPLPVDKVYAGPVKEKDMGHFNVRLNAVQTNRLIQDVPRIYHTEINDILLAALALTICEWSGKDNVSLGMEGHGREDIDAGIDISRTVGWFTTLYPVQLVVPKLRSSADLIKSVKEQLRLLPGKGLGYGVLGYINGHVSLLGTEPWDILFNYLGQLDNVVNESKWLSGAGESQGAGRSDEHLVSEKISINSSVRAGELLFNWSYSNKHYNVTTIKKLSEAYLSNLEKLIAHCIELQSNGLVMFTPSDYGLGKDIGYEELDRFLTETINGNERRRCIEGLYRLSGLQQGMLFHGLYDKTIGAYMEQLGCDLFGVDQEILKKSWALLIKHHTILRSAFYFDEFTVPVQCVFKEVELPVVLLDYRGMSEEEQVASIKEYDWADKNKGFDFKAAPLMRLALFRLTDDRYRMLWTSHHILFDGWSFPILMEEFLKTYELLSSGMEATFREIDRYEDYIRYIERTDKEKEEQYWRNYLKGLNENTLLPFISRTLERNKGQGTYQSLLIQLKGDTAAEIREFAQRYRITLNTIMQGVWAYLLHHYTGNKNIVYGIIVSGRPDDLSGVEQRVGMYINTLPLHSEMNVEQGIAEWLQQVQVEQVNSRQYQHTPFHIVQGWSGIQGDLFDTLLTFENYPVSKVISSKQWVLNAGNITMEDHTNYPLSIVIGASEQINIRFSYNNQLLEEDYVKEISGHFENVLLQLIASGDKKLSDINLLTQQEQQQLLVDFNNTRAIDQSDKTIIGLFEAQVAKTPNATALVFNEENLSYDEFNIRCNQLAHQLILKGVQPGMPVPICLPPSLEMVISILAILKAGGAYVPVDPGFPAERISYLLEDTSASIVMTDSATLPKIPISAGVELIATDEVLLNNELLISTNVNHSTNASQPAYIIYTSGSTGKPKGVIVTHSNLLNYLLNTKTNYIRPATNNAGTYLHLSYTFDASITSLFMPLITGKLLVISSKQSVDSFEDCNLLKYAPYDFIKITPAHLELLQPKFKLFGKGLLTEKLVIGGEALRPSQFDSFIADGISVEVINEYGPTEATVGCSTYTFNTVSDKDKIKNGISIGKPIDGVVMYILDEQNRLVPVGVKGEIVIGGAGVAMGYQNQQKLTDEKFITDPFGEEETDRIYRTGDIGRWLPEGNIECLGRMDDQVKIRGYRVELGEIENALQQCELVNQAVVLGKAEKEGSNRLVSYFIPHLTSIKSRELEMGYQRVASWKELYETEYGQTEGDENIAPEFNIIGWNDSFTGEAMPAEDMKEWLDDIVDVVLSANAGTVMEIGCGTGLIYYQLAGRVKKYIGSDLSISSINQIKKQISKGLRDYGDTELFTSPAHEVNVPDGQHVDTILLNSMVQYFPGEDYLTEVLDRSISLIKDKGRIIIGDVRDYRLLELFKARLRIQKLQDAVNVKEFSWGLQQDLLKEEELCISPAYFYGLKSRYSRITDVAILWKQADYENELSLYRYTVVIHIGIEKETINPDWQNWKDIERNIDGLFANNQDQQLVAIKDVPNPRLWRETVLRQALQNKSVKTVGAIRQALETEGRETKQVKQLISLALSKGYQYKFMLNDNPLKINLLLHNTILDDFIRQPDIKKIADSIAITTNIPLFTDISFLIQKDIKELLQRRLPEYMIPSEFIALRQLPLTNNGKVDRLFLGQQEDRVFTNTLNYHPPGTLLEKTIAEIWKDLLHLDRVGIEDNFFDIGGHSLLAMRLIAAIRKKLEVELHIKELFVHPTIGLLAGHIQQLGKGLSLPPIEVTNPRPEHIPLSFSQERLWFIDQLNGSTQYHIPAVLKLKGELDIAALSGAFQQIINRHEVLRTVIDMENGQGYQRVKEKGNWLLSVTDGSIHKNDKDGLQIFIKQLIETPFNLREDYMLRATLVRLDNREHLLVAILHHIASDGWSTSIMVNELAGFYNLTDGQLAVELAPLPVQYADFAIWQRKYLQGKAWDKKLAYWKNKLDGVATLQLPTDYPRPLVQSARGDIAGIKLEKDLLDQLHVYSQQQGATLFMTLLAAFNVLMHRYTGQEDICVGTPIAGRQQQELEGLIGFFVNTLALRNKSRGNESFNDLLQQVKANTLDAYEHQEVPFEKVVELVVKDRDMSRSPLFQVVFALQNTPEIEALHLGDLQLSRMGAGTARHHSSKFELSFILTETAEGLNLSMEYCTDLFNERTIRCMAAHFRNLLQSILRSPDQMIGALPMLDEVEINHLLVEMNDTKKQFNTGTTVVDIFSEQVKKNPHSIALVYGRQQLTYGQLNEASNRLAHYLISRGVASESIVPICMPRTPMMVISMLGVLKTGAAYAPIDPGYPPDRILYMLEDTGASILLTTHNSRLIFPALKNIVIIDPEGDGILLGNEPVYDPQINIAPRTLAYVVYTSGSTGKPKGVMIEHTGLTNLVYWHINDFDVTGSSHATVMAGVGFDAFGWELWPYLSSGASLYIIDDDLRVNPSRLVDFFIAHSITHSFVATALIPDFVSETTNRKLSLRYLLTGGDKLPVIKVNDLTYRLVNNYGPSENTVVASSYELSATSDGWQQDPPIGKPISNTYIYLLNEQRQPVPLGVTGELCIGGAGLARGYLNRLDLTKEKFINDPFEKSLGARLYRSGDLGRWLADGNIAYLGRKDEQVKIRGYRIELGEIETCLIQSEWVSQSVVLAKEDKTGNKKLVAYIIPKMNFEKELMLATLRTKLPDYMIPSVWIELEQLPVTANGKINKEALPDPAEHLLLTTTYVAPRTEIEEKLAAIWKELLQLERVGIYDNFFELGGHSLMAMRMVAYIEKSLLVSIPIKALFQFTSISDLSKYLAIQDKGDVDENIKPFKVFDV